MPPWGFYPRPFGADSRRTCPQDHSAPLSLKFYTCTIKVSQYTISCLYSSNCFRTPFKKGDPRIGFCLEVVDPRIHFALNCGATSCPPIKTFSATGNPTDLLKTNGMLRHSLATLEGEVDFILLYRALPSLESPSLFCCWEFLSLFSVCMRVKARLQAHCRVQCSYNYRGIGHFPTIKV